jgi:hypothetical protein
MLRHLHGLGKSTTASPTRTREYLMKNIASILRSFVVPLSEQF